MPDRPAGLRRRRTAASTDLVEVGHVEVLRTQPCAQTRGGAPRPTTPCPARSPAARNHVTNSPTTPCQRPGRQPWYSAQVAAHRSPQRQDTLGGKESLGQRADTAQQPGTVAPDRCRSVRMCSSITSSSRSASTQAANRHPRRQPGERVQQRDSRALGNNPVCRNHEFRGPIHISSGPARSSRPRAITASSRSEKKQPHPTTMPTSRAAEKPRAAPTSASSA